MSGITPRVSGFEGVDLWGFSEVTASWAGTLMQAASQGEEGSFDTILGTTGGGDRLLIVYNSTKLEKVGREELHAINVGGSVRSPLVGTFNIRATGQVFKFMVNHLYRTNDPGRHQQASQLNNWGQGESLPVIAVGDYNFDWEVQDGENKHDHGYDLMTQASVFHWIRPAVLVKTQASTGYPPSVLDFVFVHDGESGNLTGTSEIIVVPGDFPDDDNTPDHRPLLAQISLDGPGTPVVNPQPSGSGADCSKSELLARVSALQRELDGLRVILNGLPNP
jgi:hypothetical protein